MINSLIEGGSNLSKDEIEKMRQEAEANADADKKEKERIDKMNQADSMIFQTEKQVKEFADKISEDNKTEIQTALDELKDSHKSGDLDKIDASMSKLTETWNKVSTEMYQNASTDSTATDNKASDGTVDADFEEVK